MKKRFAVSLFIIFLISIFSELVLAENNINDVLGDDEFSDSQIKSEAGITPDSGFYFVEDFILSKFRGDLENREKKVVEIREMIKEGNIVAAHKALSRYKKYAEDLEKEVDPEKRDEALRSAAAIKNVLKEIENEIPEEERQEFVESIIEREGKIVTAVEIAGKIKELCKQLSKLDPLEYSRVCRSDDDSPKWQKELDEKLTDEQREEAKKFGEIMSECFKTSGQQCRCEDIPFTEFAKTCSIAAPLAIACDINGDEVACEKLDNLEMPELPSHLQRVFDRLEKDISKAQFDLHIPKECKEAGATSPNDCMKIMIQTHAPEECKDELIARNIKNERDAREVCEEIMFKLNAPEECISAGLKDPKECGKLMFKVNAPQECIDAGLTGESRSDDNKCRKIMEGLKGGEGRRDIESRGFGGNCREIQNAEERLKCYDSAISGVEDREREHFEERREFEERKELEGPKDCEGLSPEECSSKFEERGEFEEPKFEGIEEFRPPESQSSPESTQEPVPVESSESPAEETHEESSSEEGSAEITGRVIFTDNGFLNYYFGR